LDAGQPAKRAHSSTARRKSVLSSFRRIACKNNAFPRAKLARYLRYAVLGTHQQQALRPGVGAAKADITAPQDGDIVNRSVLVTGRLFGLTSGEQAFLVIQSAAPEFGKRIYPQTPLSAGENGLWSAQGIYATPNYPYRTYIVATDDPESAQLLASKVSRAHGLTQLPQGTRIISLIITVHRR